MFTAALADAAATRPAIEIATGNERDFGFIGLSWLEGGGQPVRLVCREHAPGRTGSLVEVGSGVVHFLRAVVRPDVEASPVVPKMPESDN
jgi:hypothetical protein